MLNEIARLVATRLVEKKVPYRVVYGPERGTGSLVDSRIVFEHDRDGNDRFDGPIVPHLNPKMEFSHDVAVVCRIFAQSTKSGAMQHDHDELALQILDKVLCALRNVIRKTCKSRFVLTGGKLLSKEDLQLRGMEQWPAAAYELRLSITRGVFDTDWTCAKAAEASIGEGSTGTFSQTTDVHREGSTVMEHPDGKVV